MPIDLKREPAHYFQQTRWLAKFPGGGAWGGRREHLRENLQKELDLTERDAQRLTDSLIKHARQPRDPNAEKSTFVKLLSESFPTMKKDDVHAVASGMVTQATKQPDESVWAESKKWQLFWCRAASAGGKKFDGAVVALDAEAAKNYISREGTSADPVTAEEPKAIADLDLDAKAALVRHGLQEEDDERCYGYPSRNILERCGATISGTAPDRRMHIGGETYKEGGAWSHRRDLVEQLTSGHT